MNTPEDSKGDNSLGGSRVARPRRHIEIAKLLIPLAVLAALIYLLRAVPDAVLRQEFEGFGAALCAVTYAIILFWRLSRVLAPKNPPPDVPDPEEVLPDTAELSQNDSPSQKSGAVSSGLNPPNPGT
jgi:hypothetical protein